MKAFQSFALVFFSILFFLSCIEGSVRWFLEYIPKPYHPYLHQDIAILAQSSKDALIPKDYVAIFGDSYAAGSGDWYLDSYEDFTLQRKPFHSAHVIHDRTCQDVITFGRSGAGSFDGIAYLPRVRLNSLRQRGYDISDPRVIVIYFVESNDLNDNIHFLERYTPWPDEETQLDQNFSEIYQTIDQYRSKIREKFPLFTELYVTKIFYEVARGVWVYLKRLWSPAKSDGSGLPPNEVLVGNEVVALPPQLQSPALELTPDEMALAMLVFEESVNFAMESFKNSEIMIVYLPSPLTSYDLHSPRVTIQSYHSRGVTYSSVDVERQSDIIAASVEAVASRLGLSFIDFRPLLRTKSRSELVHGPMDWNHFNRVGYELLGEAISRELKGTAADGTADSPAAPSTAASLQPSRGEVQIPAPPRGCSSS